MTDAVTTDNRELDRRLQQGTCLMETARRLIRFRVDGIPAKGVPAWVRVFGQCELQGECWVFTRAAGEDGYGVVRCQSKSIKAHRVAWEAATGAVLPADVDVCHRCDNPPCCNPAHLFLGDHASNNADRHAKGRTVMPTNGPDFWRNKTHCPANHAYTRDNVRYRSDGRRYCGQCARNRDAARRINNKEVSA